MSTVWRLLRVAYSAGVVASSVYLRVKTSATTSVVAMATLPAVPGPRV